MCRELSVDDIPSDSVSELSDDVFWSDLDSDVSNDDYFIEIRGNEMRLTGPDVDHRIKYDEASHKRLMTSLQPTCLRLTRQGDVHVEDEDVVTAPVKPRALRSVRIDSTEVARVRAELFAHRAPSETGTRDRSDSCDLLAMERDSSWSSRSASEHTSDEPRSGGVNVNAARRGANLFTPSARGSVNTKIDTTDGSRRASDVTCNGSEAKVEDCSSLDRFVPSTASVNTATKPNTAESASTSNAECQLPVRVPSPNIFRQDKLVKYSCLSLAIVAI